MKIETLPTKNLIPYARNSRTHSDAQVAQIAGSIREFGFCNPVLIDPDNGIIAGHGRVMAAQLLNLEQVPCIRLSHLTETQRRAYVIADNRLAEVGVDWNIEMLKQELEAITADGLDAMITGWDLPEMSELTPIKPVMIQPPPSVAWVLLRAPLHHFGKLQAALDSLPPEIITYTTYNNDDQDGQS